MEEVRRELIKQFGESAEDGPNSLYAGGLWVRSSMDPTLQDAAAQALRDGLANFDGGRGWRDLDMSVDLSTATGPASSTAPPVGTGFPDWMKAVVLSKSGGEARIGFANGSTGMLPASGASMPVRGVGGAAFDSLKPGHGHHRQAIGAGQLCPALGPRGLGRNAGGGGPHRPHPRHAGRLRRPRFELQPRHPGAPPAGIDVQADRLCHRAVETA